MLLLIIFYLCSCKIIFLDNIQTESTVLYSELGAMHSIELGMMCTGSLSLQSELILLCDASVSMVYLRGKWTLSDTEVSLTVSEVVTEIEP